MVLAPQFLAIIIISAAAVLVLLGLIVWICYRRRNQYTYQQVEMGLDEFLRDQRNAELRVPTEAQRAELDCRFFLRSQRVYTLLRPLNDIGSQAGKFHFIVQCNDPKTQYRDQLLSMFARPDKCVFPFTDGTRRIIARLFARIQHPFILPTTFVDIDVTKQFVVICQPYKSSGSLKDRIYETQPEYPYSRKYSNSGTVLSDAKIALYGRQILEGLLYFEQVNFPYNQLTSANVIIENNVCKLSGYENSIFGLKSSNWKFVRPVVRSLDSGTNKFSAGDVIQFGHVLYELSHGYEMDMPKADFISKSCSKKVAQVLEYIFKNVPYQGNTNATGIIPTTAELIAHPFFQEVSNQLKKTDLTIIQPEFDEDLEELLSAVRNKKKLTSSAETPDRKKSLRKKDLLRKQKVMPSSALGPPHEEDELMSPQLTSPQSSDVSRSRSTSVATSFSSNVATLAPTTSASPSKPTGSSSAAAAPPPPPASPSKTESSGAPPPPPPPPVLPAVTESRGALLSSITNFKAQQLNKVVTVDRSKPLIS